MIIFAFHMFGRLADAILDAMLTLSITENFVPSDFFSKSAFNERFSVMGSNSIM